MERFDVYDDERQLTDKTRIRGEKCERNENRQVIHVCIFNSENKMLIQKRQSTADGWPNMWDISAGGQGIAGETSRQSAHRELLEEIGIDYDFSDTRPFMTVNFDNGFDDYYFINMDIDETTLKLQKEEVSTVKWASLDEILNLRQNGEFIPYYETFLAAIFEMKQKRGARNY